MPPETHPQLRASLRAALLEIEVSADEEAVATATMRALQARDGRGLMDFFQECRERGEAITIGTWAWFLQVFDFNWDDGTEYLAPELQRLVREFPPTGDALRVALVRLCAEIYASLADGEASDDDSPDEARVDEAATFFALARVLDELGNADMAYNFASAALDSCVPERVALRHDVARFALRLALEAGRPHQVGLCGAVLASTCVALADDGDLSRLEAFDAVELAVERLRQCPKPFRMIGVREVLGAVAAHEYLSAFAVPLMSLVDEADRPPQLREGVPLDAWADRIARPRPGTDAAFDKHFIEIQRIEFEVENARIALSEAVEHVSASVDPIAMTIEHPAYRRAVPQSRSFLNERDFDQHLLVLAHEITHVMSYLGILGAAIACLRTAHFDNEITLWSNAVPPGSTHDHLRGTLSSGLLEPDPGDAVVLLRAEIGVEIALKIRILQDVWEPWFEGLAVFGETAADPSLDASRINVVMEALRGLVDFFPEEDTGADRVVKEYGKFAEEFEARCSAAMKRRGRPRLSAYLRSVDDPYFAGYIAVRAVVSAWRATYGKPLQATTAFDLLLHATRFSLRDFIPDLALRSDAFEHQARERMAAWTASLAGASAATIAEFDRPFDDADADLSYVWREGQLVRVSVSGEAGQGARDRQSGELARWLDQAFDCLLRDGDEQRLEDIDHSRLLARHGAEVLRNYRAGAAWRGTFDKQVGRAQELINAAGFLAIGRADAAFQLETAEAGPEARDAFLTVQIRTTECHVAHGRPSTNIMAFSITADEAAQVRGHYATSSRPRMRVTRVIDVNGLIFPRQPLHLLTFGYGDWFHAVGTTSMVDRILKLNPDTVDYVQRVLKRRLASDGLDRVLNGHFHAPAAALQRNQRWLQASSGSTWRLGREPVDVMEWVDLLQRRNDEALDPLSWRARRAAASSAMLAALFGDDTELPARIGMQGFEAMTEDCSEHRRELVAALITTAQLAPLPPEELEALEAARRHGTGLVDEFPHGWDVRPAQPPRRTSCS